MLAKYRKVKRFGARTRDRRPSEQPEARCGYVGLAPSLHASADKYRLGHITKQGSSLLRWVLGQAAPHAARLDADLKRTYFTLRHRRGRAKARVAVTRKLLVRLFIMLRDHIDYAEFRRRGRLPASVSAG